MASLPNSNKNNNKNGNNSKNNKNNNNSNNNNNNNNNNSNTNSMWRDDIDSPQFSFGGGYRGGIALQSRPNPMAMQESFDNMPGASAVGSIMQVWGPKQIHQHRSIPKDSGMMGPKGGSYTLEAAVPAPKGGMKMPMVPSRLEKGGGIKDSLLVENYDIVVVQKNEEANVEKPEVKNIQQQQQQQQQEQAKEEQAQESKLDEKIDDIVFQGYKDPKELIYNADVTPLIYNADYCVLDCPGSSLDADALKDAVVVDLNKLVSDKYVDWDYENRYTICGRIYKGNEDAGYRITIYLLEDDDTQDQCVLEVRRNGGDSFLFQEFKSKFLGLMSDSNSISYEKGPEFTMEHGFLASDFCDLPPLDDNDILSETEDLLTPLSSMSNMTLSANDTTNNFDANACVQEAIDTKQYRELYRECVSFLRNASDDEAKLAKIINVDNVISKLLTPIHGNRQIYDTLVIKSLLEVIYKIVCKDSSKASADDQQAIKEINDKWKSTIPHPYSDNIDGFFPSQQIQWISYECIQQFSN